MYGKTIDPDEEVVNQALKGHKLYRRKSKGYRGTNHISLFLRHLTAKSYLMRPVQMVDLKLQYQKIKKEIDSAVLEVLESSAFINGPQVQQFAASLAKYNSVKHVVPCANGTDALQIAMMGLGLEPGDEVIT